MYYKYSKIYSNQAIVPKYLQKIYSIRFYVIARRANPDVAILYRYLRRDSHGRFAPSE